MCPLLQVIVSGRVQKQILRLGLISQSFVRAVLPGEIGKRVREQRREKAKQDCGHRQSFLEGSFSLKSHRCELLEASTHQNLGTLQGVLVRALTLSTTVMQQVSGEARVPSAASHIWT